MPDQPPHKPALRRREAAEREAMRVAGDQLATVDHPSSGLSPAVIVRAVVEGVGLSAWAAAHLPSITSLLETHGAILFRNF